MDTIFNSEEYSSCKQEIDAIFGADFYEKKKKEIEDARLAEEEAKKKKIEAEKEGEEEEEREGGDENGFAARLLRNAGNLNLNDLGEEDIGEMRRQLQGGCLQQ